jgi:branched-chain amino acid aminotransferase
MFSDLADRFCYINSQLVEANFPELTNNQEVSVYEVIKIVAGVPLFFDDHYERLGQSLILANIPNELLKKAFYIEQIKALCAANAKYFGNIELRLSWSGTTMSSILGFIPHKYPEPLDYLHGVKVGLMKIERENPNAKIKNSSTRILANQYIKDQGVFEVLLINHKQGITEGSRSNVFFIQENQVYTAPGASVLKGITRNYVFKSIDAIKVPIKEQCVQVNALNAFDAAFLCGTSPGVLPIQQIGKQNFDVSNVLLRQIMKTFNDLTQNYLSTHS